MPVSPRAMTWPSPCKPKRRVGSNKDRMCDREGLIGPTDRGPARETPRDENKTRDRRAEWGPRPQLPFRVGTKVAVRLSWGVSAATVVAQVSVPEAPHSPTELCGAKGRQRRERRTP
jgi:hypothetical protein